MHIVSAIVQVDSAVCRTYACDPVGNIFTGVYRAARNVVVTHRSTHVTNRRDFRCTANTGTAAPAFGPVENRLQTSRIDLQDTQQRHACLHQPPR